MERQGFGTLGRGLELTLPGFDQAGFLSKCDSLSLHAFVGRDRIPRVIAIFCREGWKGG